MATEKNTDLTPEVQSRQRQNEILEEQLELLSSQSKSCYAELLPELTRAMIEIYQLLRANDRPFNSRVELDGEQFSEAVQRYMRGIFAESQPSSDN